MKKLISDTSQYLTTSVDWLKIFYAILIIIIGLALLRFLIFLIMRVTKKRFSPQANMLIRKTLLYVGIIIILVTVLNQMGVSLTAFLGAAGIAGIAIGFAAQTSISNVISGVFLVSEKSFEIGDLLKIGETVGIVTSIDILAVKLKTFDNRLIRIPNETIIKSEIQNITRFPVRRIDLDISIAYKDDAFRVQDILMEIARDNPFCLNDPPPLFSYKRFGDSGQELMFGVWCVKEDYLSLKNSILPEIKKRFDKEGIEIPFPHISLYSGSGTSPFPVELDPERKL